MDRGLREDSRCPGFLPSLEPCGFDKFTRLLRLYAPQSQRAIPAYTTHPSSQSFSNHSGSIATVPSNTMPPQKTNSITPRGMPTPAYRSPLLQRVGARRGPMRLARLHRLRWLHPTRRPQDRTDPRDTRRTSICRATVGAVNPIARFVDGAKFVASILDNSRPHLRPA